MKVKNLYRDVTKRGAFLKLLPFQGDRRATIITQGAALGYELLPFQGVRRKRRCPLGIPPDLKSGVKKGPNLLRLCGFEIRSKQDCFSG